jgi:hypothetical protein
VNLPVKHFLIVFILSMCSGFCCSLHAQGNHPQSSQFDIDPNTIEVGADPRGSTYVPMDSWIYPAMDRLYALGYADSAFFGIRPWTRLSLAHILERTSDQIETDSNNDEARAIYSAVLRELQLDLNQTSPRFQPKVHPESVYADLRGIGGVPLRDSFHLGQSIINDYGRPYENGFNSYTGASTRAEAGRFSLYFRGEYQNAPTAAGYSPTLAAFLSNSVDGIPFATNPLQDTIPEGPIDSASLFRVVEASLSYHLIGHELSFGKNDHWLAPDRGASMLWSNNAENIYAFQIDKVEPFRVPLLSRLTGPFRYDFFVGSLKGHTYPNDPWVHMEKISFKPTENLEFGFDRLTIWGGEGHEPITIHTFLKSFFSFQNVSAAEKFSRNDPGARFGTFDFSYRLPFLRRWITLYTDSLVHDDVSPVSAIRRSGIHPGIYLSHLPVFEHVDLRLEGASTDTVSSSVEAGQFLYYETIQRQGPTNKGFLVGDWVGRQGKGGQAWLTYHLSPLDEVSLTYRNAKASNEFIPGGTTQNAYELFLRKRIMKDFEVQGSVQYEDWKAPLYKPGAQSDFTTSARITWFTP